MNVEALAYSEYVKTEFERFMPARGLLGRPIEDPLVPAIAAAGGNITDAIMAGRAAHLEKQLGEVRNALGALETRVVGSIEPVQVQILARLSEIEAKIADVVASNRPTQEVRDERLEWIAAHPEEVAEFRGKRIAVHPTKGIVAHGDTYKDVRDQVKAVNMLREVLITSVPPA